MITWNFAHKTQHSRLPKAHLNRLEGKCIKKLGKPSESQSHQQHLTTCHITDSAVISQAMWHPHLGAASPARFDLTITAISSLRGNQAEPNQVVAITRLNPQKSNISKSVFLNPKFIPPNMTSTRDLETCVSHGSLSKATVQKPISWLSLQHKEKALSFDTWLVDLHDQIPSSSVKLYQGSSRVLEALAPNVVTFSSLCHGAT